MKLGRLNHIGVVVPDMDEAVAFWRDVMGATSFHTADVPQDGLNIIFVDTPTHSGMDGTQMELIQPLNDETAVSAFLAKNPSGGQHHVCFEVSDIEAARAEFESQGKRVLGPTRIGAHGTPIFFVHPKDMGGILTEILETPKEGH
ncbi:methylmalonyl-CoA epimerase [Altererythrobacter lutimaris]|uniref:Methylmalonyl-CoA epimerase n=1 Tax=Altererythrobacter lutimaris TaxID=2743979 RepID=A0A850H9Z9_9SPHN|nr:methylmalonyl-CoA epimerase [Altererythrobacter lutimaris]NVE94300.1 methylmalonyl-CoA epimerase [Altererythrobacter lutimaris]